MSETADKIVIECPTCHKQYRLAAAMLGKKASCRCGTVIPVELPSSGPPQENLPPPEPAPPEVAKDKDAETPAAKGLATVTPPIRPPLEDTSFDPPPAPVVTSPTDCASHPGTPAMYACAECHKLICRACAYSQQDGRNLCTTCAILSASPCQGGSKAFSSAVVVGTCAAHPDVSAVVRCRYCHALLCATCDFAFDKDLHLCARCATTPPRGLGRCRKFLLIGSLVALSLTLAGTVAKYALSNSLPEELGPWGDLLLTRLFACVLLIPAIIGFAMACGSFARRAANPPVLWASLSLNTLMLVFWLGMQLVLMFSSLSQPPESPEPETPAVESVPEPAPPPVPVDDSAWDGRGFGGGYV